jgi:(2Fe-2S) ferredoxin
VIISDLERQWYRPLDEGKFERLMRRVFQQGDVVIYQR